MVFDSDTWSFSRRKAVCTRGVLWVVRRNASVFSDNF